MARCKTCVDLRVDGAGDIPASPYNITQTTVTVNRGARNSRKFRNFGNRECRANLLQLFYSGGNARYPILGIARLSSGRPSV